MTLTPQMRRPARRHCNEICGARGARDNVCSYWNFLRTLAESERRIYHLQLVAIETEIEEDEPSPDVADFLR